MADAYADLCTQYNLWEWAFQNEMNIWLISKETLISNFGVTGKNVQMKDLPNLLKEMLNEASNKLDEEENKIIANLEKYFEKKDSKVSLVEKYRLDFLSSANSLKKQTDNVIRQSLEKAVDIRRGMEKVNIIKENQMETINELLQNCRKKNKNMSKGELTTEFEKMWEGIMSQLSGITLPKKDVYNDVLYQLKLNLSPKRGHVTQMLSSITLKSCGKEKFTVRCDWFSDRAYYSRRWFSTIVHMDKKHFIDKMQDHCDSIITNCQDKISDHVRTMEQNNTDYNEAYVKDILQVIDDQVKDQRLTDECETKLKFHICGLAARLFQEAHNRFNVLNDPQGRLMEFKPVFLNEVLESFNEKDHCSKKATE